MKKWLEVFLKNSNHITTDRIAIDRIKMIACMLVISKKYKVEVDDVFRKYISLPVIRRYLQVASVVCLGDFSGKK